MGKRCTDYRIGRRVRWQRHLEIDRDRYADLLTDAKLDLGYVLVSGKLPDVRQVARALDMEGSRVALEQTGAVGARHRSAYRLADALPGAVIVVISQDGGVRFICRKGDHVTYWEQD